MKKHFLILSLFLFLIIFNGCASILHGSRQHFHVTAQPSGANIKITNASGTTLYQGTDSLFVNLKRGAGFFKEANYLISVEKLGYDSISVPLKGTLDTTACAGNIIFGGLLGLIIIDPLTGAMWTLEPGNFQDSNNIRIILKENANKEMMDKAIKIK